VPCLDDGQLLALLEHRLPADAAAKAQEHVDACDDCRVLVADLIGAAAVTEPAASAKGDEVTSGTTQIFPRGATIGRYVVLDLIGRGGMGVVYGAYDPELDRRVALKLVRADSPVSRGLEQRLVREAQALARTSHPNVVHVYEAGVWNGQLFIAMEWVDGGTLSQWLREKRRDWHQIREIFVAAGRGLAAAHSAGLVHRDFKPENVMIGKDGRARVTDFGLARRAGSTGELHEASLDSPLYRHLTATGAIMGTPGYMAPEQLRGEVIDARSDLFSFCVALYEALAGARPFAGRSRRELLAAIDKGELDSVAALPRELRRTLARGLRPKPEERHASMEALLAELTYDPSLRRRRWIGASAIVALIAVGAVSWYQLGQRHNQLCRGAEQKLAGIWDLGQRARLHSAFVATGLIYAEPVWRSVADTLDSYAEHWKAMRTQACEETRLRGEQSEAVMDLRMECLERHRESLRALVELFAQKDPQLLQRAVQASQSLSGFDECRNADALRQVVRPPPGAEAQARVAALRTSLANVEARVNAGRYIEARKPIEEAVAKARNLAYAPVLAEALYWHALVQEKCGDPRSSADTLLVAATTAEAAHDDHEVAVVLSRRVYVLGALLERHAEAHSDYALARAVLARAGGDPVLEARLDGNEASVFKEEARYDDALALYKKVLLRFEELLGPDNAMVGLTHYNIGNEYLERGNLDLAIASLQRALTIQQKTLGPDHPIVANTWNSLGGALLNNGDTRSAVMAFEKALALEEAALGHDHRTVAQAYSNLGLAFVESRQFEKARSVLERALAIYLRVLGPEDIALSYTETYLGMLFLRTGKPDIALPHAERALAIRQKVLGNDHPLVADVLSRLGRVHNARRQFGEALPRLERAVAIFEHHPADPEWQAEARFALACALWDSGRDRARARTLALAARDHLHGSELTELEAWLTMHASSR
jgi:tetratricopeptide (TPR) repeat protein